MHYILMYSIRQHEYVAVKENLKTTISNYINLQIKHLEE